MSAEEIYATSIGELYAIADRASDGPWTAHHRWGSDVWYSWLCNPKTNYTMEDEVGSSVYCGGASLNSFYPHRNATANAEFVATFNPVLVKTMLDVMQAVEIALHEFDGADAGALQMIRDAAARYDDVVTS